jgi:uncharacterized protein YeaO (DUF488 family)
MTEIRLKRAYVAAEEADGYRILVDRLWPRGQTKEVLKLDRGAKGIAPSSELRKAWHLRTCRSATDSHPRLCGQKCRNQPCDGAS